MEGKVAIVTGGAGGLGSEICRKFSARGAAVAVADMNAETASEVARSITSDRSRAIAVQVEVTDEDSVIAAVRTVVNDLGRVDYLVHCAGTNIKAPVLEMSLAQWNFSLEAHLTGAFLFCREAGRRMVEQGDGGSVVLMSSVAGTAPAPERGAYGPAKAALINFAGQLGLRVGAIRNQRQRRLSRRRDNTHDRDGVQQRAGTARAEIEAVPDQA